MQRNSLTFNPQIAQLAMPSAENWGTALGKGMKEIGATVNMARDRGRKEGFEDKAENRESEKHGWAGEKHGWAGETHAQNMTKGALDIEGKGLDNDYKRQSNPIKLEGLGLKNSRSRQVIDQSNDLHPLNIQAKKQNISQSAELHVPALEASWLKNSNTKQKMKIDLGSYITKQKADEQTYDINEAKEQTRKEIAPLKIKYEQKKIKDWGKIKKTTKQQDYEYGLKNPDFAKQQEKTATKKDKTYSPTSAMKAWKEDFESIPEGEREQWAKDNPKIEYRRKFNQARKMTGSLSAAEIIAEERAKLSKKIGGKKLANVDFAKAIRDGQITSLDKEAYLDQVATTKRAIQVEAIMAKERGAMGELAGMAEGFAMASQAKHVDTNILNNAIDSTKTFIPNLDYDSKELQNEAFRRDFLGFSATLLKIQSGLTVSDKERANFEKTLGTLDKNKKANFIGIRQKLKHTYNRYNGIKTTQPIYFNMQYGDQLRGLENSINMIDGYLHNKPSGKSMVRDINDVMRNNSNIQTPVSTSSPTPQGEIRVLKDGRRVQMFSDGKVRPVQ